VLEGLGLCIAYEAARGSSIDSFLASPKKVPAPSAR
jgi:alanyl aminopeptidase